MKKEATNSIHVKPDSKISEIADCLYYCSDQNISETIPTIENSKSVVMTDMPVSIAKNFQPTFEAEKRIVFTDYLTSGVYFKRNSKISENVLNSNKSCAFKTFVEYDENCGDVDRKEVIQAFTENANEFTTNSHRNSCTDLTAKENEVLNPNECTKPTVVDLILQDFDCTLDTGPVNAMDNLPHSPLFILLEKPKRFYSRNSNSKTKVNRNENFLNVLTSTNTEILCETNSSDKSCDENSNSSLLSVEELCPQNNISISKISFTGSQCLYENLLNLSEHFSCVDSSKANKNSCSSKYNAKNKSLTNLSVDEITVVSNTPECINFKTDEMFSESVTSNGTESCIPPRLSELMSSILTLQKKKLYCWKDDFYNCNSNKEFYGFSLSNEEKENNKTSRAQFDKHLPKPHKSMDFAMSPCTADGKLSHVNTEIDKNASLNDWWSTETDHELASVKFQDIPSSVMSTESSQRLQVTSEQRYITNVDSFHAFNSPDCTKDLKDIAKPNKTHSPTIKLNEGNDMHLAPTALTKQDPCQEATISESVNCFKDNEIADHDPLWGDDNCEFWLNFRTQEVIDIENNVLRNKPLNSKLYSQCHQNDHKLHDINVGLQTASGKTLNVSSKARNAVQHLVNESFKALDENTTNCEQELKAMKMKIQSKAKTLKSNESQRTTLKQPNHKMNNLHTLNAQDNAERIDLISSEALTPQFQNNSVAVVSHNAIASKNNANNIVESQPSINQVSEILNDCPSEFELNCNVRRAEMKYLKDIYDPNETLADILNDLAAMKNKTGEFGSRKFAKTGEKHDVHHDCYAIKQIGLSNLKNDENLPATDFLASNELETTAVTVFPKRETLSNLTRNSSSMQNTSNLNANGSPVSSRVSNKSSVIGRKNLLSLSKKRKRKEQTKQHIKETTPKHTFQSANNIPNNNCTPGLQHFISNSSACSTPILPKTKHHPNNDDLIGFQSINSNNDNEQDYSITNNASDASVSCNSLAGNNNTPKPLSEQQTSTTTTKSPMSSTSANAVNTRTFISTSFSKDNNPNICRPSGLRRSRRAEKN